MTIEEMLSYFFKDKYNQLTRPEHLLLEANLFMRLYEEMKELLKNHFRSYQKLIKGEENKEDEVIETNFLRYLINDIISTNEYTLEGIANVFRMPIDAIYEIATGINYNPSLQLSTKIIKLHSDVRGELYNELIKRIVCDTHAELN